MTESEYFDYIYNEEEEYKQVILFHQLLDYEVSNKGNIRKISTNKQLKLSAESGCINCYHFITLKLNSGVRYNTGIHRLIAIMFIPIPDRYIEAGLTYEDLDVNHKDGKKYHNVLPNLEWVTRSENIRHAYNTGLVSGYKLTETDVHNICKLICKNYNIATISEELGISESTVRSIKEKRMWRRIVDQYEFPSKQLSEESVRTICEYIVKGYSNNSISKMTDVSIGAIEHIRLRNSWTDISKDYEFPEKRKSRDLVHKICKMLEDGYDYRTIAETLDVRVEYVKKISYGDTRTDISKNYNIPHKKFKLADEVVHSICKDIENKNGTLQEIADRNGVSRTFVKDIKGRKSRKDISVNYTW